SRSPRPPRSATCRCGRRCASPRAAPTRARGTARTARPEPIEPVSGAGRTWPEFRRRRSGDAGCDVDALGGCDPEQYEAVRKAVNWEGDTPEGGLFHVSWFDADGL